MKVLSCTHCKKFLGEIERGKLRNGSVLLCDECWKILETIVYSSNIGKKYDKNKNRFNFEASDFMGLFGMTR